MWVCMFVLVVLFLSVFCYFVVNLSYRVLICCVFFFFKQKTAYDMRISDWSSDVCSSDLTGGGETVLRQHLPQHPGDLRIILDEQNVPCGAWRGGRRHGHTAIPGRRRNDAIVLGLGPSVIHASI